MAIRSKSKRKRGSQSPERYPVPVGDNYQYWGEQTGYIYDPWSDKYIADPKLQQQYGEQTGLAEKKAKVEKPPGVWEQSAATVLPVLASQAGLLALKSYLTPDVGKGAISGPYGGGNIYDYPGGPLDATSASGGIYPGAAGGLIGASGFDPATDTFAFDSPVADLNAAGISTGGQMPQDQSWLNSMYQDSMLQSGVNGLLGLFGY